MNAGAADQDAGMRSIFQAAQHLGCVVACAVAKWMGRAAWVAFVVALGQSSPARTQRDFMFWAEPPASLLPFPLPVLIPGTGNPDFDSEDVLAYELGCRVRLHPRLTGLRLVDSLPGLGIGADTELDTRVAWRPNRPCECALVGRNWIDAHHREFAPVVIGNQDVQADRAVYAKFTLHF